MISPNYSHCYQIYVIDNFCDSNLSSLGERKTIAGSMKYTFQTDVAYITVIKLLPGAIWLTQIK